MTDLTHPATGHQINVDDESADFWRGAGYRDSGTKSAPQKAPAKKSAAKKTGK